MPKADPWTNYAQARVHHVCTADLDALGDKTTVEMTFELIWIKFSERKLLQPSTMRSVNRELSVPTAVEL